MSADVMVRAEGVVKRFGPMTALRGIDLQLRRGCTLGLFGPNGAGKTTLLNILATLTRPSAGMVWIAGYDARRDAAKIRPLLGVLTHRTFLYGHLTAYENLRFYGRLFGVPRLTERITDVLHTVDLLTQAHQLVRTYSRGMQQRLAIARAIVHSPALLLLDEPYTGLDKHATDRLQALLQQLRGEACTIMLSTHDWHGGFEGYDEVAIQCRGHIVYRGTSCGLDVPGFDQLYRTYVG